MKIITAPDPILQKKSTLISSDKKVHHLIKQMKQKLKDTNDLGLAAPQVGKNWRLFVINLPNRPAKAYLNPQITDHGDTKKLFRIAELDHQHQEDQPFLEGCLSLPQVYGAVKRWPEISVEWQNEAGKKETTTFTNLAAIIFQHELDHLNGILFTQRLLEQDGQAYQEKNGQLQEISL